MADKFDQSGKGRPYHAFGAALQLRRKRKYSQEGFAGVVGVHRDTVGSWERGEAFPSRDYWPTIERELKFTEQEVDGLLGSGGHSGADQSALDGSAVALSGQGLVRVDGVAAQYVRKQDKAIDDPALSVGTASLAGVDPWTPGPASRHIIQVYAADLGGKAAARIAQLAEEAIRAIGRGDFTEQGRIADDVLRIAQDAKSRRLRGEAEYLKAESLRLLADFERDRNKVRNLRNQALGSYENAATDLGEDPRPLRGSGRILEVMGDPDAALMRFGKAASLSEQKLAQSHPLNQFSLAHEHVRSLRHEFNCLADIETSSLLSSSQRTGQLEKLLQLSEKRHEQVLARFRHVEDWWRIEWFMAQVFHARGWAVVNQHGLAAKRLTWALEQRLKMMPDDGKMSDVETGNLAWWLRTALSVVVGFESEERRKLERLAAEISSQAPRDRIHAAGGALLQLRHAPWERGSSGHSASTGE